MITVCKTPLRVSFFGGGSDYPEIFENKPGAVLGTTINLFIYTMVLPMAKYAEHRYRISYRNVEAVDTVAEIQHPVVREAIKLYGLQDRPLNISTMSDVPGNSGLGSSSAFAVGFCKLMNHLKQRDISKYDLAWEAIHLERELLKENVGIQDQVHATFGGLNIYRFQKDGFSIEPLAIATEVRQKLRDSMYLIHTGVARHASSILQEQVAKNHAGSNTAKLDEITSIVDHAADIIKGKDPESVMRELGMLLQLSWDIKKSLSTQISTPHIDSIFDATHRVGAYGAKLCGAGGGGYIFCLISSDRENALREAVGSKVVIKVDMEELGSRILGV